MNEDLAKAIARAQRHHEAVQKGQSVTDAAREKRDAAIVEAASFGATAYRLAKELGITTQAVDYILRRSRDERGLAQRANRD